MLLKTIYRLIIKEKIACFKNILVKDLSYVIDYIVSNRGSSLACKYCVIFQAFKIIHPKTSLKVIRTYGIKVNTLCYQQYIGLPREMFIPVILNMAFNLCRE